MTDGEMRETLADHMEAGFLENIIDMFRHDGSLLRHVPALIEDERGRVRLGAVALAEALKVTHPNDMAGIIPETARLLRHEDPVIRADAAYLLGIIGSAEAIPYLEAARHDENAAVREIIEEAIAEIG
jgi:HEAT repeat protein